MKTLLKSLACMSFLIFMFSTLSFGQNTKMELQTLVTLSGDSETEEIELEIVEQCIKLSLTIRSTIQSGDLTIEIYNPIGEKQGNFSVGSQMNSKVIKGSGSDEAEKKEEVNGRIEKLVEDPMKGTWIIKLIPNQAYGNVNVSSKQIYNDN